MNLLKNLARSAIIVIFGQLCCYYLYWVHGSPWAAVPREWLGILCFMALISSFIVSGILWTDSRGRCCLD